MSPEPWLFLVSLLGFLAAAYFVVWVGGRVKERVRPSGPVVLSLLVVARDASAWVEGLIREIYRLEEAWGNGRLCLDVLAVDDGSADETPLILERLRREYLSFKVIAREQEGLPALERGMACCRSPVVLVLRAGPAAEPRQIVRTLRSLLGRHPPGRLEEKAPGR